MHSPFHQIVYFTINNFLTTTMASLTCLTPLGRCASCRSKTRSSHYKDFNSVNAGLEGLVFFPKALVPPLEVGDVFDYFGEDGRLREFVSYSAEAIEEEKCKDKG
jgi:hypothetical protein